MQISRQRDERRRRVFADEVTSATAGQGVDAEAGAPPTRPRRRVELTKYGEPGFMENQPRINDLVPRGYLAISLWLTAGVAVIGGLEVLYYWMPDLAKTATDGRIAAFDLDGEGSLAVWFSSMTLGLAAAMSLLVFSMRRHKADDYHGRYRIWLWASMVWFMMSVDETSSLHEGFKELMTQVSGTRIHGDGSLWWVLAYGLVFLAVCSRLVFQLRACASSAVAFVLAMGGYAAAVATQLGWILPESGARGVMLEEGLEMGANVLLLLSVTLFARFVVLESQGLLGAKEAKPRKVRPSKIDSDGPTKKAETGTMTTRPTSPATVTSRPINVAAARANLRVDSAEGLHSSRRLSKAERRALRRSDSDQDDE